MYGLQETVLSAICEIAESLFIERVILFGSRARGDYKERSDIDLAVYGEQADLFGLEADEKVPTLLKFDVVNMMLPVQEELSEAIRRDGVILYEKI